MVSTDASEERTQQRRRSWRTMWIGISLLLVIPVIACVGVATWFFGRQAAAQAKCDLLIAELSQIGDPLDSESMARFVEQRTSDKNIDAWVSLEAQFSTEAYLDATRIMPFHEEHGAKLPTAAAIGSQWTDRKLVDEFLQQHRGELDELLRLAIAEASGDEKPLRRPIIFDGLLTSLSGTDRLQTMTRLLMLQHAVAVFDGDTQLAMKCIQANRGLECSTFGEPLMVCQMVGQWVASNTNLMIQRSLQADQLSDAQLSELAENLTDFNQAHALYVMAIKGEIGTMLPIFSDPDQMNKAMDMETPDGSKLLSKLRATDTLFYLETMRKFVDVPDEDPQKFLDAVNGETAVLRAELAKGGIIQSLDRSMSQLLVPAVDGFANGMVQRVEKNRLARIAMGVRKFEHQFDRWPSSLDELTDIGVDPKLTMCTGDSFGYRIEDNGDATLWGFNRANKESVPSEPPPIDGESDSENQVWVWTLKRVSRPDTSK